jgi:glutamate racemase
VEEIETGDLDGQRIRSMLYLFLQPLMQQRVDTLVLGCTHYPFIAPLIREILGEDIAIIDSGDAVACELQRQLQKRQLLSYGRAKGDMVVEFWRSGDDHDLPAVMSRLWGGLISPKQLSF